MKQTYDCHKSSCKHVNSKRTIDQNSAMHLWFQHVADELNGAGLPIKQTLAHYKVDLDWSAESVKSLIWKPIQWALFAKKSTTDLKKGEIDPIFEHINRFLSQLGVHVDFPHDPQKQKEKQYLGAPKLPTPYPEDYSPTNFD